jgi:hypothetical protein
MTYRTADERFREGVHAISKRLRKTAWRPKYKVGMPVLTRQGEEGVIEYVSPGYPRPGYVIRVTKSRYYATGSTLFIGEADIRAHKSARHYGPTLTSKHRRRSRGKVWPGALTPSTKRQQYKWRQLKARIDSDPSLSSGERQRLLDEGYQRIFQRRGR